jgi:hypothetical protein
MSTDNSLLENDEPVNKKAFSNGSKSCWRWKKNGLLNHFNLSKKSGDDSHLCKYQILFENIMFQY